MLLASRTSGTSIRHPSRAGRHRSRSFPPPRPGPCRIDPPLKLAAIPALMWPLLLLAACASYAPNSLPGGVDLRDKPILLTVSPPTSRCRCCGLTASTSAAPSTSTRSRPSRWWPTRTSGLRGRASTCRVPRPSRGSACRHDRRASRGRPRRLAGTACRAAGALRDAGSAGLVVKSPAIVGLTQSR